MVGNNAEYLAPDAEMLKERGFAVYTCSDDIVSEMIDEVKPAVVFINPDNPGLSSTKVYHELLDNIHFASLPVIYTLSEDDVYLVNRRRTASRDKRNMICDNVIDSIKTALLADTDFKKRKRVKLNTDFHTPFYASRA